MDVPETPQRQALMFVRLVAGCLILIGLLDTSLYVAHCFRLKKPATPIQSPNPAPVVRLEQAEPVRALPIVFNSIPFVAGVVIWIKAKAAAEWVSDKLE